MELWEEKIPSKINKALFSAQPLKNVMFPKNFVLLKLRPLWQVGIKDSIAR